MTWVISQPSSAVNSDAGHSATATTVRSPARCGPHAHITNARDYGRVAAESRSARSSRERSHHAELRPIDRRFGERIKRVQRRQNDAAGDRLLTGSHRWTRLEPAHRGPNTPDDVGPVDSGELAAPIRRRGPAAARSLI